MRAKPIEVRSGVAVRLDTPIAEVVLSRPERRNALDLEMWVRLREAFEALGPVADLRVIVLRGDSGHFSVGSDIRQFQEHRSGIAAADRYNAAIADALEAVMHAPQPVIAMIQGLAVGGGCEIACASDIRVAATDARLGLPVAKLGVSIGPTEAAALLRAISPARLKDLLLTGRLIDANEALRLGLVDRVIAPAELAPATWQLAHEVADGAPLAAIANKLTVNAVADATLDRVGARIRQLDVAIYEGAELQEGIRAFLEKREPRFRGAAVPEIGMRR